jgi:putative ubiquitin-RnfH superfamily antitoxin RatB of RatAB toxin-antitoxin module
MDSNLRKIEVVYAPLKGDIFMVELEIPVGTTVGAAIQQSAVLERYPEINFDKGYGLGIYSRKVALTQILQEGDRVEIYRPLQVDPKEARRLRARKKPR